MYDHVPSHVKVAVIAHDNGEGIRLQNGIGLFLWLGACWSANKLFGIVCVGYHDGCGRAMGRHDIKGCKPHFVLVCRQCGLRVEVDCDVKTHGDLVSLFEA